MDLDSAVGDGREAASSDEQVAKASGMSTKGSDLDDAPPKDAAGAHVEAIEVKDLSAKPISGADLKKGSKTFGKVLARVRTRTAIP